MEDADAGAVIGRLGLQPHPEGGWYRETWRAPSVDGARGAGTAIHYLLQRGERSHWHRIDAAEVWLHQGGGVLRLSVATDAGVVLHRLGGGSGPGETLQAVVEPGQWQAAEPEGAWALVACVVAPAFDFSGFEIAPPGWRPAGA